MEYSIRELSDLAGVSTRTLRYYDEIGLLRPLYINDAGYRYYGEKEVVLLQQILFYRERGFALKNIQEILCQDNFTVMHALQEHLLDLEEQRKQMDALIQTVRRTISSMKGEFNMSDKEKFTALKEMVKKNEEMYGKEVRKKYGDEMAEASNQKILNMTIEEWERFKELEQEILNSLKEGVRSGIRPDSEQAKEIVKLHKAWLCMTWKQYTAEAHKGLAQMYICDKRFQQYYDQEVPGCAELLKDAVNCLAEKI